MKNCENCTASMSKVVLSSADWQRNEQRHEQRDKRHWVLHIILIGALLLSNLAWIIYESQFETVATSEEYSVEQTTESGNNNSIINGGTINGEE